MVKSSRTVASRTMVRLPTTSPWMWSSAMIQVPSTVSKAFATLVLKRTTNIKKKYSPALLVGEYFY